MAGEYNTSWINIPEIVDNIKYSLIAASVQNKRLFKEVLKEYYIRQPITQLIRNIVDAVYESKKVENVITKLDGGVPVNYKMFTEYILETVKVLTDIVDRFIKPNSP